LNRFTILDFLLSIAIFGIGFILGFALCSWGSNRKIINDIKFKGYYDIDNETRIKGKLYKLELKPTDLIKE